MLIDSDSGHGPAKRQGHGEPPSDLNALRSTKHYCLLLILLIVISLGIVVEFRLPPWSIAIGSAWFPLLRSQLKRKAYLEDRVAHREDYMNFVRMGGSFAPMSAAQYIDCLNPKTEGLLHKLVDGLIELLKKHQE
jgi:hypothetical protein